MTELGLGLGLLTGTLTRLVALAGFLWQVNIALQAFNVPGEWYWIWPLLTLPLFCFAFAGAGRVLGVDHLLSRRCRRRVRPGARGRGWCSTPCDPRRGDEWERASSWAVSEPRACSATRWVCRCSSTGSPRTHLAYIGLFVGLFLLYVPAIIASPCDRARMIAFSWALVLGFAFLFRVSLLASPVVLSSDVYRYLWDGRVQLGGDQPVPLPAGGRRARAAARRDDPSEHQPPRQADGLPAWRRGRLRAGGARGARQPRRDGARSCWRVRP